MTIPDRFQVFANSVTLSDKDAERLSPCLTGWLRLHAVFLQGINTPDLQRLVILELMGQRRRDVLGRLVGRLTTLERGAVQTKIEAVTGKKQAGWWKPKKRRKTL